MAEWTFWRESNTDTGNSDKTFLVPNNKSLHLLWIYVTLTSTATAGNRQLRLAINNSDSVSIGEYRAGAVQAESLTRYYMFAPGIDDLTSFRDTDLLNIVISPMVILPQQYGLRIYDGGAIAADSDDMTVTVAGMIRSEARLLSA